MVRLEIDPKWCKGCGICAAFCPRQVLELREETAFAAHPEACVGCRMCEYRCPDFAILVKEEA